MKKRISVVILIAATSLFSQNLASLHDMLINFYCYQRAGLKSGSSGNCNGMNQHTGDNYNGSPLDGGWYDAGDYIKFGMPLSYTVYCLLKGYDLFPSAYTVSGGIPNILTQVKYATDYLMKAVINENTIILDVGKAAEEHQTWGVVNGAGRDASKCLTCTGGDVPAVYAACLALMSTLYRKYDAKYADDCLAKAITAFKFAKKKIDAGGDNNLYCQAQQKDGKYLYYYYKPEGGDLQRQINDKMVAAGVELYRATNDADPIYKAWAKRTIVENYNCMCYSFIGPLAAIEVWRQGLGGAGSVSENVGFVEAMVQSSGVFNGVYKNSGWGTARDIGTAAFVYALGYIITSTESQRTLYLKRAKDHVAWVSGTNSLNRSFIVGFGNNPPTNIHYRPSSSGPKGGVVSGPNGDGQWSNDGSAEFCEVALDYNAGITGAVAFLKAIENPGSDVKVSSAFSSTPSNEVDFTSQSVTFKAGFSSSVKWTIKISGGFGSKTYTGNGSSINQTWDGSADNGFFLSGENVAANLSIDGNIVAYDIMKARAISLYISKVKKPAASSGDVLIDDFEDGDTLNKVNGKWVPFGSQTSFALKTKLLFTDFENSKALQITCNVPSGEPTTFAGVKATFNSAGTPQPIGNSKAVVFKMKAAKDVLVSVELEQPGITDSAYYCKIVPVTKESNTYRLPISEFRQPDWKTGDKPLDLNSISALRFTVYDSTGRIDLLLDDVYIDSFSNTKTARIGRGTVWSRGRPALFNRSLRFAAPSRGTSSLELIIYDMGGRVVVKEKIVADEGETVMVPLTGLPRGVYTMVNMVDGKPAGKGFLFTVAE